MFRTKPTNIRLFKKTLCLLIVDCPICQKTYPAKKDRYNYVQSHNCYTNIRSVILYHQRKSALLFRQKASGENYCVNYKPFSKCCHLFVLVVMLVSERLRYCSESPPNLRAGKITLKNVWLRYSGVIRCFL